MAMFGGCYWLCGQGASAADGFKYSVRMHTRSLCEEEGEFLSDYIMESHASHVWLHHRGARVAVQLRTMEHQGLFLLILGHVREDSIHSGRPSIDHILETVAHNGPEALQELEGQFVCVFDESASKTIHIVNDRFSARPFYLKIESDRVLYASSMEFLLSLSGEHGEMDPLGCLQLFRYNHTLCQRTSIRGVERIPPASHITLSPDGVKRERYWRLRHAPDPGLDPARHAREVFEAFRESTDWRSRLASNPVIALSGGLDSRLVAGCIPRDVAARAFTFVNSTATTDTPEVSSASAVARALDMAHTIRAIPSEEFSGFATRAVRLTDGLVPVQHPSMVMQHINQLDGENGFLIGGGPGDVLAGSYIPRVEFLDPNRTAELVDWFCKNRGVGHCFPRAALSRVFSDDLLETYLPLLDGSMRDSFADLEGPTAAHRITAWAMTVRQPAFTFTTPFHKHPLVLEATPHLGYRYSDLMLMLPAEWLFRRNFYSYMLYHVFPELHEIPYANTGMPLTGELITYEWKQAADKGRPSASSEVVSSLARKVERYFRRFLRRNRSSLESKPQPPDPADFPFHYALFHRDSDLLDRVEGLIQTGPLAGLLDQQRGLKLVSSVRAGVKVTGDWYYDAELLGSLVSLCVYSEALNRKSPL